MIEEKEKPRPLIEAVKERINYLEANDPDNVTLKPLRQKISDYLSEVINI
ncbi:MAG: hypothetical protein ACYSWS_07350 [Planctomycetota bacterium]|jgi:hypothetical protein